jgi:hypothetical protein
LWKREADLGREEGEKDRPTTVLLTVRRDEKDTGLFRVAVLPIMHSPPQDPADAIEIPLSTADKLGLGGERSWIVVTKLNEFLWPGPDLRPIPGREPSTVEYGRLPGKLMTQVVAAVRAKVLGHAFAVTVRR